MTWKEIKMQLDRIEEIGQKAYVYFSIGNDQKGIVIGGEDNSDCVGCRCAWNIGPKSNKLIITEHCEYSNGTNIARRYSIPITSIIGIDELPF